MRIRIRESSAGAILLWFQRVLFTFAFLLFGYCAYVMTDTWIFQHRAISKLGQIERQSHPDRTVPEISQTPLPHSSAPEAGSLIGRVDVDRLGISVALVEGAETPELRHAAGHITGTALPGETGNSGIAAHRDTFFRPLRNIRANDIIRVTTPEGEYRYRVVSTKVVKPEDVSVLNPDGNEILTLVTCYPFYYVGSAPNRFIVRAERTVESAAQPASGTMQPKS